MEKKISEQRQARYGLWVGANRLVLRCARYCAGDDIAKTRLVELQHRRRNTARHIRAVLCDGADKGLSEITQRPSIGDHAVPIAHFYLSGQRPRPDHLHFDALGTPCPKPLQNVEVTRHVVAQAAKAAAARNHAPPARPPVKRNIEQRCGASNCVEAHTALRQLRDMWKRRLGDNDICRSDKIRAGQRPKPERGWGWVGI